MAVGSIVGVGSVVGSSEAVGSSVGSAVGADVLSVVTDITLDPDPDARVRAWVEATR